MQISPVGIAIYLVLCLPLFWGQAPLMAALVASFAFGATAVVTLDSLGGASPLAFAAVGATFLGLTLLRRESPQRLGLACARTPTIWVVLALAAYVGFGAYVFPRMFDGQTTVFVALRMLGVLEVPLSPSASNITQAFYFIFGCALFVATAMVLTERGALRAAAAGFFAFAALNAILGAADLLGKLAGAGDVLEPIRTASFSYLTSEDVALAGFLRIAGPYSEASAFGTAAAGSLAFAVAYWRNVRSFWAFVLIAMLLPLVMLSTSSTAYVTLVALGLLLAASALRNGFGGRILVQDAVLAVAAFAALTGLLALYIANSEAFEPARRLIETSVINKAGSDSAVERSTWNARSLATIVDTAGLGIGIGSSRASSWLVALLAQLGLFGAALMLTVVGVLLRRAPEVETLEGRRIKALHDGVGACAVALLLSATLSGATADPGGLFFMAAATALACRYHLRVLARPAPAGAPTQLAYA